MDDHVSHVAMHEQLAWQQTDDLIGWHPAVRTADPEKLWGLLMCQPLEEIWLALQLALGPRTIVSK